ncbi:MAG: ral secretion pathway protein [Pseudomonadota bacterium]|nr:ral secretion pathway protein [Pseudomonadota bacterium]
MSLLSPVVLFSIRRGLRCTGRQRGLSLIESMLVLCLLGVLLALAMPLWQKQRERALQRQAAQEIGAMSAVISQYRLDNQGAPASLAAVGMAGRLDPWGRSYVYYNLETGKSSGARKNRSLTPVNNDFDLYSLGPDGASALALTTQSSQDDVVRANNGRFIGPASTFTD